MKSSRILPWACGVALLLHATPAAAQSLDQVPLEKRISILEDKVFLDFPATALYRGEVPGVPFQPQNPHDYTTVMYYNGVDTLSVWATHEFAFPKQDYLKEWLDPNNPGERNRKVLIDRDGLVAVLLPPRDYATGSSGVFLQRLFVRTPDNLLFRFGVYLNNSALPCAAEYARLSERILSTMKVGKPDKGLVARQEKLPIGTSSQAMLFDLPARYHILAHRDRGIQTFMLRYYYALDSADKWHEMIIEFDERGTTLREDNRLSEKDCKKVKGTLLGDKVTWLQFYKPDYYWVRELVMPFPSLGAGISMHVYMCTNVEQRLDELTRIAARIQLVER